ncbi:thiamine pyrophosphate TPP-binding domain-containing protein [Thermovirga lienii DSM 17291]|uniref:Thiamine pyrophosphate TPP-binding domain-containing protein n=1 Tax=Thermovirga lienii (strain ATCC BAA-1197 / DSM 17291 / Cas60314) TaxID=580340 RepID=G7V8X6_THELD|nr:5-guanidino-2-oxopentanoate decarboxylase [Thermovirga lienii]AER67510.1 thiamine pyrophosphate TPP-binding domain-containing protein [Thermovirga lienii DSM 17291]MDN5319479.1 5-guanidino-2-oxopentanoate decarboxylase [Thermovirga sp.]MDN5368518.1 5-guanidino-2-oxopentanoate decarboxylase [Thermovirga sp.]
MKINASEALVKTLESVGVTTIFGIPGIHNLDIYKALTKSPIRHITTRHEQGAGFMADGWARSTGNVGTALVISGPGLTNILTPMAQALHDSVPMVVISSQIPTSYIGLGAGFLHELKNSTIMAQSAAKESIRITDPRDIQQTVEKAYKTAASGRPGPVHLEIPMDVLTMHSAFTTSPSKTEQTWYPELPEQEIKKAANVIKEAKNPVIILGGGSKNASCEALALAEKLQAAVIETCAGKGIVDDRHPLCLGARLHFPSVRKFIEEADVIIAVGTELSPTDLWEKPLPKRGILIQIDLDPANFGRNTTADIGIRADARQALLSILKELSEGPTIPHPEKKALLANLKRQTKKELGSTTGMGEDLADMVDLISAIREGLPENGILAADMTGPAYIAISEYPTYFPSTFLHPVGFGTLGFAVPAAIGAFLANNDKPVAALTGDGGFQFTMAEVAVACQEKLPIPIIIWNDQGFGEIRRNEKARDFCPLIGVDNPSPDLKLFAASLGAKYQLANSPRDVKDLMKSAFKESCPTIIEITPKEREH